MHRTLQAIGVSTTMIFIANAMYRTLLTACGTAEGIGWGGSFNANIYFGIEID